MTENKNPNQKEAKRKKKQKQKQQEQHYIIFTTNEYVYSQHPMEQIIDIE